MFNTALLDVIVGLSFLYLFLSLFCSTVTELLAGAFGWRAEILLLTVRRMVGVSMQGAIYQHPLIACLSHQTVRSKIRDPAYIPTRLFVVALLDELFGEPGTGAGRQRPTTLPQIRERLAQIVGEDRGADRKTAARAILALLDDPVGPGVWPAVLGADDAVDDGIPALQPGYSAAAGQPAPAQDGAGNEQTAEARLRLEGWYNSVMERACGAYKRRAQMSVLTTALVLCVAANMDTVSIARRLWSSETVREVVRTEQEHKAKTRAADEARAAPHNVTATSATAAGARASTETSVSPATASPETASTAHERAAQVSTPLPFPFDSADEKRPWKRRSDCC